MSCTDWRWWCAREGGRSPVEKDFHDLPKDVQGAFLRLMEAWMTGVLASDGDACKRYGQYGILYFRHSKGNNPYRLFFVMEGTIAIILDAQHKNQRKIDNETKARLKSRARSGSSKEFS